MLQEQAADDGAEVRMAELEGLERRAATGWRLRDERRRGRRRAP